VGTHVARRGEARPEVGLQVLDGDERRELARHARPRCVEHVGMGVDQAGKHRRLRQVNHFSSGRNPDLAFRSNIRDPFALQNDHLPREQLPRVAVEQPAGTHGDHARRRRALNDAAL